MVNFEVVLRVSFIPLVVVMSGVVKAILSGENESVGEVLNAKLKVFFYIDA